MSLFHSSAGSVNMVRMNSSCHPRLGSKSCNRRIWRRPKPVSSIGKARLRCRKVNISTSTISTSTRGNGFPRFAKLPLEIRLKIWKMTTEERRIVTIQTTKDGLGFVSPAPIPAALHICSESREVSIKTYQLSFGSRTDHFEPHIFFNFDQDTLYFREDQNSGSNPPHSHIGVFGTGIRPEERVKILSFAVDMNTGSPSEALRYSNLQQWTGLREIRLCLEEPRLDLKSDLAFRELEKKDHWAFVRDFQRTVDFGLVEWRVAPSRSIKKIEDKCMDSVPALNEILEEGGGAGFSLAVVVNA